MLKYIDGPEARFTPNDGIFIDLELFSGEKYTSLEPHRLFPKSGGNKYVTLLNSEGEQIAIIRDTCRRIHARWWRTRWRNTT